MSIPDMPPVPRPDRDAPPPAHKPRRRVWRKVTRVLAWSGVTLLLLVMVLIGTVVLALRTEGGTRQLWAVATRLSGGLLAGQFEGGTVATGLHLRDVVYASGEGDAATRVTIDRVDGEWSFTWSPARLHVQSLRLGRVDARLPAATPDQAATPARMPDSLSLPLAIDVDTLTLERLSILEGNAPTATPLVFSDLAAALHSDGTRHRLTVDRLVTPYGKLQANAQLAGPKPYPLTAEALLEGEWQKESFALSATASGSLDALRAELEASGDRIRGRATADLTPFGRVPFTHLLVDGERINPRLFSPGAPQANLTVHAELRPVEAVAPPPVIARPQPGQTAASAVAAASAASASAPVPTPATPAPGVAPLAVAGELTVRNLEPGPIDKERLPVESVHARVEVSEAAQSVRDLRIALLGRGEILGQGMLRDGRGGFDLDVRRLDVAALHTALVPTRLAGPVILRLEPGRQSVALDLAGGELKLFADARVDEDAVTLTSLRAGIGAGTLTADGRLALKEEQAFHFKGKLANFDPARVAKVAPGRINADFSTTGTLSTGSVPDRLRVAVDFGLRESEYAGLPMTGNGKVRFEGERLLPSEASLSMAGNQVDLRGSFGARGDRLKVAIDAPQLERLKFGVAGRAKVDAEVTGTLRRPEVVGDYSAQGLVFGPHKLASASGHAELRGGLDGTLSAQLTARDYQGPDAVVRTLDANLTGTQANHTFEAKAVGTVRRRQIQLNLAGQGGWQGQGKNGGGWNGTIRTFEERGAANLRLTAPTTLLVADQHIKLGPARFAFDQATMAIDGLDWDHGRIRSAGSLDGVRVAHVLELVALFSGEAPPVRSDLVLDGKWNLVLAETASGFAEIRRRSGDASINAGRGWTALGLGETQLRAEVVGSRVTLRGGTAAERIGRIVVDASAGLVSEQGLQNIGPTSTLDGTVAFDIPRLKSLESFTGPQYALEGKLAANLKLAGTVGKPLLTGNVDGSGIGVTLYDLGIRLTDGVVKVVLDQNTVELKQVQFRGGDGTLVATGAIKLGESDPNLTGKIVADKLQLFASPERTLIVSGEAGIANENRQLTIRGKFRVDRGLFDLPKSGAPELGDDVVVIRHRDQRELPTANVPVPEEAPTSRFSPVIDIAIDLGNDFRFRGAGADLLLAGQLGIASAPLSPMRATGTVRVVDGTYEAFGRKLNIERGIINFNGPISNPNINIRAMRRNQEVEAGVEVTGTVRIPRVRLVSEPNVPDEDKLSWLMFGYGAESAGAGQQRQLSGGALGGAALGMIGARAGKGIVQHLGIDEFSIGPSTAGLNDQQVVSVGKSVTDQISVGYEQSLTSASNIVKLTWAFSRRWSLIAKGGSINGLSVLFNRRFNNWSSLFAGSTNRRTTDVDPDLPPGTQPANSAASEPAGDPIEAIKR
ncbi:translocation/assembly module TamB domain-containing protein [Cupriavidus pampae]|uniref:Translocation and assembly module TamB C-terminal domain-containing protein n=1 Tax=Cupriavidus pampae TaxID=659251 RepID=A0ABN7YZR5_9BURK|nr:translocation/assembly module TamB domain-containing protein [Cupriavidus pampae]CAG9179214.1 hypothetical protein LMG32289_04300 [Cupriavidus pampae]